MGAQGRLVGSGLMAGGTATAMAATDESTTSAPSVTQEEGTAADGSTTEDGATGIAPEDCAEGCGAGGPGMRGTADGTADGGMTEGDVQTKGDTQTEGTSASTGPSV